MIKLNSKRGYTLLFAVLTATFVLSISAFIISVSKKQLLLSSTARESTRAFFAADTGIECAISNFHLLGSNLRGNYHLVCGGQAYDIQYIDLNATDGRSYFYIPGGSMDGSTCAYVTVTQTYANNKMTTVIESRGYNIGWNRAFKDCSLSGPRKVERALRLVYSQ